MTAPEKAIESREVPLTPEQIAELKGICARTLSAHPELSPWIRNIPISKNEQLPFLPIRCFRLANVSRFSEPGQGKHGDWTKEFLSSGSTNALRARHRMAAQGLAAYRTSSCEGLVAVEKCFGIASTTPIVSLVPSHEVWPDSSLAAMLSFWREAGFDVHWVDLEQGAGNLERQLSELQRNTNHFQEFILFGTSLHHLQIAQWQKTVRKGQPFIDAKQVWCFDTGGTKGRTQSVSQATLHSSIRSWFNESCRVSLLSEYGMCELSSQAYSLHEPHSQTFRCAPSLKVLAVSPELDRILPSGEKGFLGFIDFANVDSWPCIISEDLGTTLETENDIFSLEGRAPDATVKGCSLNVRETYRFDIDTTTTPLSFATATAADQSSLQNNTTLKRKLFSAHEFLSSIQKDAWTNSTLADLEGCLENWSAPENEAQLSSAVSLKGETIAIVASANIPISWFFPVTHAWLMQAESIILYLPSTRQDDPISAIVRRQIKSLVDAFNLLTRNDFIAIRNERLLEDSSYREAHRLLVFGTDGTIKTISDELFRRKSKTKLIGLGHFQNSFQVQNETSSSFVANVCAQWMGRGCLTPVELELPPAWSPASCAEFCKDVFKELSAELSQRAFENKSIVTSSLHQFAHQHNLAEVRALAAQSALGLTIWQDSKIGAVVVDLTRTQQLPEDLLQKTREFAGCGWVNIVHGRQAPLLPLESPAPGLWEKHQGYYWQDWFFRTGKDGE
jgi:hypothetical protein